MGKIVENNVSAKRTEVLTPDIKSKKSRCSRAILGPKMTIKTKSMMRRRVNRAGPSGLV